MDDGQLYLEGTRVVDRSLGPATQSKNGLMSAEDKKIVDNILGNLATVEIGSTASKAYAVGNYLVMGEQLYKVKSAIAQGDTLTVNGNIVATNVGAEVDETNKLNNIVMKTLTVAGWQLSGSQYVQTIAFTKIHSMKPIITACGETLGSLATDAQYAALGRLKVTGDTDTNTFTFYAATAPTVDINLSIQGVS